MSSPLLVEARPVQEEPVWIELDDECLADEAEDLNAVVLRELDKLDTQNGAGVELRGHGEDHHGVLPASSVTRAGKDPAPAPPVESWDF
jgi:hypothetical protein